MSLNCLSSIMFESDIAASEEMENGTVTKAFEFNDLDPSEYNSLIVKIDGSYKGIALSQLTKEELEYE